MISSLDGPSIKIKMDYLLKIKLVCLLKINMVSFYQEVCIPVLYNMYVVNYIIPQLNHSRQCFYALIVPVYHKLHST